MNTAITQFNPDQLKLVRETVAKGTNEAEFNLFIEVCKYHGLNPFARQIYAVVRDGYAGRQLTIQTSIDGYRLLAERSGKYAGQMGPQWCGDDGVWVDVWLKDTPPAAARVGVLRKDFDQPVWGIARYKSYVQTKKDGGPTTMWHKMHDVMLAKCAESLALRKAFPDQMSGIYTKEEMDQADSDLPTVALHQTVDAEQEQSANSDPTPLVTPPNQRLNALCAKAIVLAQFEKSKVAAENKVAFLKWCSGVVGDVVTNTAQLTPSRLDTIEQYLDSQDAA